MEEVREALASVSAILHCAADRIVRALEARGGGVEEKLLIGESSHFLFGIHWSTLARHGGSGGAAWRQCKPVLVHHRCVGDAVGDLSVPQRTLIKRFSERGGGGDPIDEIEERHDPEPR